VTTLYKGWHSDDWAGWAFIHPANDVFAHEPYSSTCPCNPRIDRKTSSLVHYAFDGRDLIAKLQRGEKIV
jgi:hypothetical protein